MFFFQLLFLVKYKVHDPVPKIDTKTGTEKKPSKSRSKISCFFKYVLVILLFVVIDVT